MYGIPNLIFRISLFGEGEALGQSHEAGSRPSPLTFSITYCKATKHQGNRQSSGREAELQKPYR